MATVAATVLICIALIVWAMVLRGNRLKVEAAAEQYSIEGEAQAQLNEERAELLKPEHESELLSRAAAEGGYVDSVDSVFRLKN